MNSNQYRYTKKCAGFQIQNRLFDIFYAVKNKSLYIILSLQFK